VDEDSMFQKKMVEYLEDIHMGGFLTGSHQDVQQKVNNSMIQDEYDNPTETMPIPPPLKYSMDCWCKDFEDTVNDILLRSNIHTCQGGSKEF